MCSPGCTGPSEPGAVGADKRTSLYSILGVSIKATAEEIRLSYLRLARLWHPDRHFGDDSAKRKFQQVQCAYEVLSNPRRRQHYDLQWLELLDVEDYLNRFQDLVLTANGLGMSLGHTRTSSDTASSAKQQLSPNSTWHSMCHASLTTA